MNSTNVSETITPTERFDAFVSYDRSDKTDVAFIMEQLHTRGGISYFIDDQIRPGDNWIQLLTEKLALAETFLFFIRAIPTNWQMRELNVAISMQTSSPNGKPAIFPVLLPNSPKNAFFENRNLAFLHQTHAAQFKVQISELDVIDSLARAVSDKSRVWVSSRAFRRPDDLPPSFQADLGGLTDLLIGESVYKREDICVRELIQNARDACSRVVTVLTPGHRLPETIVVVDEQNRYFDVIDFGDGMSKETLTESFSLLGKSLNTDIDLFRRTQSLENPVTGKFGIGFVSVFMIAERVVVSTKSIREHSEPCYHFTIQRATLPFTFHMQESRCGRIYADNGTTVRVYLKSGFVAGPKQLDIKKIAEKYCRHVPLLFVEERHSKRVVETDWNTDTASPVSVAMKADQYEVRMSWATDKIQGIVLSNGGFFVTELGDTVLGGFPNAFISGEINVVPGFVDLNIARDTVVDNEKVNSLREVLSDCLSKLFEKSVAFVENVGSSDFDEVTRTTVSIMKNAAIAAGLVSNGRKIGLLRLIRFSNFDSLYFAALASHLASRVVEKEGGNLIFIRKRILSGNLRIVHADSFSSEWKEIFLKERVKKGFVAFITSKFVVQVSGREITILEARMFTRLPSDAKLRVLTEEEACSRYYGWFTLKGFLQRSPPVFVLLALSALALFGYLWGIKSSSENTDLRVQVKQSQTKVEAIRKELNAQVLQKQAELEIIQARLNSLAPKPTIPPGNAEANEPKAKLK